MWMMSEYRTSITDRRHNPEVPTFRQTKRDELKSKPAKSDEQRSEAAKKK